MSGNVEPCPFCGGEPSESWDGLPFEAAEQYVACCHCGLVLDGNADGFQQWNRASLHVQHSQAVLWLESIKLMPEGVWERKESRDELLGSWMVAMREVEVLTGKLEEVGWR
jgi:hypothetical protein